MTGGDGVLAMTAGIRSARSALGVLLAEWRGTARLTQEELAQHIGCSRSTIATIERGIDGGSPELWARADYVVGADGLLVKARAELDHLWRQLYESRQPPRCPTCGRPGRIVREDDAPPRKPNDLLRQARLALISPTGSGRRLSRQELADAVNEELARLGVALTVTSDYVGRLERGELRWPGASYRTAFRAVFGVEKDSDLGFYITRR